MTWSGSCRVAEPVRCSRCGRTIEVGEECWVTVICRSKHDAFGRTEGYCEFIKGHEPHVRKIITFTTDRNLSVVTYYSHLEIRCERRPTRRPWLVRLPGCYGTGKRR